MKIGLLGLPQVGKKTLFSLLTGQTVDGEKLKKGVLPGTVPVRDARFEKLVAMFQPKRRVPATVEFLLFPDFDLSHSSGEAQFRALDQADVLCHLVRAFPEQSVFHVKGSVDPARDIEAMNGELLLRDLMFVEKRLERMEKERDKRDAGARVREQKLMEAMRGCLEQDLPLRSMELSDEDYELISGYSLLTLKQLIIVLNVDEEQLRDEALARGLEERFAVQQLHVLPVSVRTEKDLDEFDAEEEKAAFMAELGLDEPALERLTRLCYQALGLIPFFTVGPDEVRAWMVQRDAPAPKAARAIHRDFEKGFIRVEVIKYDDLIALGSEAAVKEAGKLLVKGKDYLVQDGDVLHFLFNV